MDSKTLDYSQDPEFKTRLLLGQDALDTLHSSCVMVIGVGGVGGSCVEALARAGVGKLVLVDPDVVSATNLNRQAVAFRSTIGRPKVEVARELVADIAPSIDVVARTERVLPSDVAALLAEPVDFVVDAQDTVATKIELADQCAQKGIRLVSSMGTGNKLHPELFRIADIRDTSVCPLCRQVRKSLKARGVPTLTVLYSTEQPRKVAGIEGAPRSERTYVGTVSFVPPAAGLMLAGHVVRTLCAID